MSRHPSGWERLSEQPMIVAVQLKCGHRIIASEEDGGMDEVPRPSWRLLEDVAKQRVVTHAVLGCDIVWAGEMFIEQWREAEADARYDIAHGVT